MEHRDDGRVTMQDLRLIGVHEDGEHLLLSDAEGRRYRLGLDEPLRAATRRDRARLGQLQLEIDGGIRPREVQALIRAGASAEEVSERSGWPVEKVRRYEGPILAEREHMAGLARAVPLRGRGSVHGGASATLASRVLQRLAGRGVDPATAMWDSARDAEGEWSVTVLFAAGGRQRSGSWAFDAASSTVHAKDDEARWLSEDEPAAPGPLPAPHLVSPTGRPSTVYDVEAEGGVQATARPGGTAATGSTAAARPIDLISAMREHSSAGGRRSARRRGPAAETPLDAAPREDALPLEDVVYDPETMAPPPAAGGEHPLDENQPADGPLDEPGDAEGRRPDAADREPADREPADREPADREPADREPADRGPDAVDGEPVGRRPDAADREPDDGPPAAGDDPGEAAPDRPAKAARRRGRPSVPSWDDIMFGAPRRD